MNEDTDEYDECIDCGGPVYRTTLCGPCLRKRHECEMGVER